jgi:hypothetical protein
MDHSRQQQREYLASIALSNAAVSLLQYNLCAEAYQTFRDAIEIVEMSDEGSSTETVTKRPLVHPQSTQRRKIVDEKLERASVHLASLRSKFGRDPPAMPILVISSEIHPKVLSDKLDLPLPPDSIVVVFMEASWDITNPIESTTTTGCSRNQLQLLLAALNYNLAAAVRYRFLIQQECPTPPMRGETNESLLSESFIILTRRVDQQLSLLWTETSHSHVKQRSLSLWLLLLRSLVQMSFELNWHADEVRIYSHRLFDMNKQIAQLSESIIHPEECIDFMAPAA